MASDSLQRDRKVGRNAVIILLVLMISGAALLTRLIHLTSSDLVNMLDSTDSDRVSHSLQVLKDRGDPAGISKAINLMDSGDPEVSMDAALYVGAMKRAEAVPYLLKALPIAEAPYRDDVVQELTALTGEKFGGDAGAWHDWWIGNHRLATQR